jgi:hypothetical protein
MNPSVSLPICTRRSLIFWTCGSDSRGLHGVTSQKIVLVSSVLSVIRAPMSLEKGSSGFTTKILCPFLISTLTTSFWHYLAQTRKDLQIATLLSAGVGGGALLLQFLPFTQILLSSRLLSKIVNIRMFLFIHSPYTVPLRCWGSFFLSGSYTVSRTPWMSDRPVARLLPKHRINTYTHPKWNSNPRYRPPSERRQFMP